MNLPKRKLQRLKDYDYSQEGAYFITICTQNQLHLFGSIDNGILTLNDAGLMVFNKLGEMTENYPNILADKFIVMPNHVHLILFLHSKEVLRVTLDTTLQEYIKRFKSLTTRLYIEGVREGKYPSFNKRIWQVSFYDRIIRNNAEYLKIWEYIDTNPLKWQEDKYYVDRRM